MEVHHHSHTDRKKFTHYLWEFLMLFLAVFCGFLAENQREHMMEKDREKQYIESMLMDITADTSTVNSACTFHMTRLAGFDSLLQVVYQLPYSDSTLKFLYYLNRRYISTRSSLLFTKRTIIQLKNAGGLRLIRNRAASDSIVVYDEACERIESQMNDAFVPIINDHVNPLGNKIFDMQYLQQYKSLAEFLHGDKPLTLLNPDKKLIYEYANWVYYARGYLNRYISLLKTHQERSLRLIELLKKEYHLK